MDRWELRDAHQSGGMSDLLDNSTVTEVLQGEPERQCSQLRHRLAGGQTCSQRLRHKTYRYRAVSHPTMRLDEVGVCVCSQELLIQSTAHGAGLLLGNQGRAVSWLVQFGQVTC